MHDIHDRLAELERRVTALETFRGTFSMPTVGPQEMDWPVPAAENPLDKPANHVEGEA